MLKIKASKRIHPKNWDQSRRRYRWAEQFASICLPPSIKILQTIWQTVLIDFQWFTYFDILKYAPPIIQKSVWWSFKNQKSEMYILFVYPCWSSWHMTFWPYPNVSGGKLGQKMDCFWFFEKLRNLSNVLRKSITM